MWRFIRQEQEQEQQEKPTRRLQLEAMKVSSKETSSKSKGFSKGKQGDVKRLGPIMVEEILSDAAPFKKNDISIREMVMRTDPSNDSIYKHDYGILT